MSPATAADALLDLLARSATTAYIGEPISQLEHALQCGRLATEAGARGELVLAALLHDVGHLCAPDDAPQMAGLGVARHETIGADHLRAFGVAEEIAALVEGHVAAKRYLVSRTPGYMDRLSEASLGTLAHQGGAMSAAEAEAFEAAPLFREVLRVRAWDEQAKRIGWDVPGLSAYRALLIAHIAAR